MEEDNLRIYVLKNNFKYSLEHKYIINTTIINELWNDLDYYRDDESEKYYLDELDNYERINKYIKTILDTINI